MNKEKKKNWKGVGFAVLGAVICGGIAFLIFSLTAEKRTEIIGSEKIQTMSSLVCEKLGNDNEYFNVERKVVDGKHELRANFGDDRLIDLMYSFKAHYDDGIDLEYMKNVAEANFNLAYGNRYEYRDNLWSVSFTMDKNSNLVKMNIYAGADSLSSDVATVFQLEKDKSFPKTVDGMKSAYENTGFACVFSRK